MIPEAYVWLVWSAAFLVPWAWLYRRVPAHRRAMLWASTFTTPFGQRRQDMKMVSAIIRTSKLKAVEDALVESGRPDISVTRVAGYAGRPMLARSELTPHVRVDIVLQDSAVEAVIERICAAAWTGLSGDGVAYVQHVDRIIKVKGSRRGG